MRTSSTRGTSKPSQRSWRATSTDRLTARRSHEPGRRPAGRVSRLRPGGGPISAAPISLSGLTIDVVVALSQRPSGAGSSEVARIIEGPGTTVQSSLKLLMDHALVQRDGVHYHLRVDAPGVSEIVRLGLLLSAPPDAIRLVLRANEAVELAISDTGGFVVAERHTDADANALERLDDALELIRRIREETPPVLRFETRELARIIRTAVGLRTRIALGDVVKGTVRRIGTVPPA